MKRLLKWSIWTYLILLIFEGAIRKWAFPGAQLVFLVIRDPLVILIYFFAIGSGIVPRNAFIATVGILAVLSVVFSFLAGQSNPIVLVYGLRINYLHVPLIWVMAEALDRRDVERLGSLILLIVLPMTAVMTLQFRSPMDAWINRGVGGDDIGQIYGALGRIRPPGFFSFITGPMVFFPLAAAFFLYQATSRRRLWWIVLLASGVAIVVALPISVSRGTMITTGFVGLVYVVCMLRAGLINGSIVRFAFIGGIVLVALSFLPIFKTAREVFMSRWDTAAAESEGHAWASLSDRVISGFTEPLESAFSAPFFGNGIGVGSNVGARLLAGRSGFLLAENEWEKSFLELGPLLGGAFILLRVSIVGSLFLAALKALLRERDPLPMGIWAAALPVILLDQWGPPTLLGFAVFGGGLLLASLNPVEEDDEDEEADEDETDDSDEEAEKEIDPEVSSLLEAQRRRMRGL